MTPRTLALAAAALSLAACASQPRAVPVPGQSAGWPASSPAETPPGPAADARLTADVILSGGRVFLGDSAGTVVQGLAVRDGRVLAAGGPEEVEQFRGRNTREIDLGGRLVTAGFNDAHVHFAPGGASLINVNLLGTTSLAEIERRVAEAAARARPGEWIVGRGWDHTRLPAGELGAGGWPTRAPLDRAAPRNPVLLGRVDGHTSWANGEALRVAGITRRTRNPAGGEIVRDPATGEATGILKESAETLVTRHVPPPTAEQTRRGVRAALELAARTGVTSVQTSADAVDVRVYRELRDADSLSVRVYAWHPLEWNTIRAFRDLGITAGSGDEWLRVGMVKGYTDGTLGSRTAFMLEPFADAHTHGLPQYTRAGLDSLVTAADAAGLQVILHAIGDAANRQALDAFERAARANGPRERRHRIEHAQVLDRGDIPRFRQLGVIASMQPTHATSDMRWVETRIGRERAVEGAYVWRSLLDAGARVVFGTDFPVEPLPPVEGIYSAVTRQSREEPGTPPGGWLPEQRLSREEAIRLYTAAPAFGEWQETRKGTLQPGMLADLVVWDRDLLTVPEAEILRAAPVLTMIGGRVVYEKR